MVFCSLKTNILWVYKAVGNREVSFDELGELGCEARWKQCCARKRPSKEELIVMSELGNRFHFL